MSWGRASRHYGPQVLKPVKVRNCIRGAVLGMYLPAAAFGLALGLAAAPASSQDQSVVGSEVDRIIDSPLRILQTGRTVVPPPPKPESVSAAVVGEVLPTLELCGTKTEATNCVPGIRIGLPNVPSAFKELLGEGGNIETLGLLYNTTAALVQVANNVTSVALGITQDVVTNVLDVAIEPETAAVLGPFGASSPGSASSMFMVSGYKHLSHDGYSVASSFGEAIGKGPEFKEDNVGLTLGTRFDGSSVLGTEKGTVTFGVLGNYTHTDIDVGATPSLPGQKSGSVSIESWSVGGYGMVTDGQRYGLITITGTVGSPETERRAFVPATADYNTFGFAASAMSGVLVPVGGAKLDLRGGLNYLRASSDDYTDSAGSHYTDARMEEFSGSLSARLFGVVRTEDFSVRPFVQGGVNYRFLYENEITIDDATFAFDDADTSIFGRVGFDFDVDKAIQAYVAVRGDASEDFTAIAAQVGVTFKLD